MPERRSGTCFWLLTSLIGGSLVCSLAGVFGLLLPVSLIGAPALAGLALGVFAWTHRPRSLPPDSNSGRSEIDASQASYAAAVKCLYTLRVSKGAGLDLLDRTAGFLSVCERLKDSLAKARQTWTGPGTDAACDDPAGGSAPILQEIISTVREMAGVLRDVDHNAKELITSTEETAYSMTRLDSFLQDMANNGRDLEASTDTANRVALEGTKVVEEMGRENEAIITTVNEAASAVEDLGRWSQEVGKIVEVIRDIANETNLLALNASIIAAQSGEHGKAFGVVAEEIRGLAERTSSSTKEISDLVKAVQKNVANVVNGMKKSLQRVERGELLTRNAGTVLEKVFESFESSRSLAKQIASSTFEHKIDSSQVVRSLHKVTDIARRLQDHNYAGWTGAGETLGAARALNSLSDSRTPIEAGEDGWRGLLAACDKEIGGCVDSLKATRDTVDSWLKAVEQVSQGVTTGVEPALAGSGPSDLRPCWELAQCEARLRDKCPAYTKGDRSLFFSREAACMQERAGQDIEEAAAEVASPYGAGHTSQIAHKVGS